MPDYSEKIRTITSNSRKQAEGVFEPESMDIEELAVLLESDLADGLDDETVKKIRRVKGANTLYDEIKTGFTTSSDTCAGFNERGNGRSTEDCARASSD